MDGSGCWLRWGHSTSTFAGWGLAEAVDKAAGGRTPRRVLVSVRPDLDLADVRRAAGALGPDLVIDVMHATPVADTVDASEAGGFASVAVLACGSTACREECRNAAQPFSAVGLSTPWTRTLNVPQATGA